MSKDNKKPLLPKWRFSEFGDSETWTSKSLNKILIFTDRKVKKPEKPYTRLGIRSHGKGTFLVFNEPPEKNAMDYLYEVKKNDLIVNITFAWEGAIAIVSKNDEGALVSHRFPTYVFNEREAIPSFFKYLIIDKYFIYKLGVISPGGAGRNRVLNKADFLKLKVNIPKIPEQQKIADCLTSLDELITDEDEKFEAYKAHKKGLMQKLFPAAGKTVPEWRFPEFRGKNGWEAKEFSKYIVLYRGSSPRPIQDYLTKKNNGVNWIKIGDTKSTENFIIRHVEVKITPKGAEKARKVNIGELILANSMSFGKTYQLAIDGFIYDGWFVLREYEKYFHKQFLLQLLNSDYMQNQYFKLSAGGIVQNISSAIVYNTILPHTTFPEQQKIADCLSSLDELITAQAQKIEVLKNHKKGLRQGLFLATDEVIE